MEEKEVLKNLILANYIEMIKRKNKAEISDFMNNPKTLLSFLHALGASEEMLCMPAHRETLEDCLKSIISSTLNAIRDGETGLKVEYLENGLMTHTESLKYEETYALQIGQDYYTFDVARNVGEISKGIMASVKNGGYIASRIQNRNFCETSVVTKYLNLDEAGFVISQAIQENGKEKSKIMKRDGMRIFVDDDKKGFAWNGSPSELNEQKASVKEFQRNMCQTISKYPETKEYYENIVGKDVVDKVMKVLETKKNRS